MIRAAIYTKESGSPGRRHSVHASSGMYSHEKRWDYTLSPVQNHELVALQFITKMGWDKQISLYGATAANGRDYVFVQVPLPIAYSPTPQLRLV